ncbi:single-stranded DNA-binding protein, mitochondrial-like [Planococcus citri]|uniref:single-stranded DNA-binding protein, mitochondrial-like n=1 Tax=Planococcus citri TaxID=170843 RepID=UPI0031F74D7B
MNTIARKLFGGRCGVSKNIARFYSDEGKYEKSINTVTLLGRVGGEAQKKGTELHPLVTFSLATHINYKSDSGTFNQKTDWHRICVFKPNLRDNVLNYMKKGQRVYVSGKIMYGEIRDESGGVRSTTSILADDVIFFQR